MSQLDHHVSTVRSREGMTRALSAFGWAAVGLAGAAVIAVVLEKFLLWRSDAPAYHWLAGRPLTALAIAGGVATVAAIAWGIRRRPGPADAAAAIDAKLGTHEKFSTALYLQNHGELASDPFVRAMIGDAMATAARVDLGDRFPIRFPRHLSIAIAVGLLAFGLTFLGRHDLFGREAKAQLAKVELQKQEAAKQEMEMVLAQLNNAPDDVKADANVTLARQNLQEMLKGDLRDATAGTRTAAKAQQALQDATVSKERIKNAQNFAKAKQNQKLLASIADPKDKTPIAEMAREIQAGEFARAMDQMGKLAGTFDKMDAAEQEKAAAQMQAMANQLQQAVQQNAQLQQLAQQMQANGVNQQQVQQLQQLMQQAAQGNPQAAQQAQQMAQQMMQQANATPAQQQAVQQLAQQMQGAQNQQALMQQMQQAAAQMAGAMQQQAAQQGVAPQQAGQQGAQQQGGPQQAAQQQAGQPQGGQQSGAQQQQASQPQGGQQGTQQSQGTQQQSGQQQAGQQQSGAQQQAGQQQGAQQQGGPQAGNQQGAPQQGGPQQGAQQQAGQPQGGQPQGGGQQQGQGQGVGSMQDQIDAIKKDMQQMQAAQQQQGGQQQGGQQAGQGGGQQPNGQAAGQGGAGGNQGGQANGNRQRQQGNQGGNGGGPQQGQPRGQGNGMGGPGQGAGGLAPMTEAPFDFKQEISKSHDDDKGQTLAQTFVKADAEKGESTAELREVVRSNLQESTDEVDSQRISRQAQKAVRDYFTTITNDPTAVPAAEPAPAEQK